MGISNANVYEDNCGIVPQQSNGSVFQENCVSLTDWTDASRGDGVVSAVDYLNQKTFKLDSGSAGSGNDAEILQDVGTFGNRVVATIKLNSSFLGNRADLDHLAFQVRKAGVLLSAELASDGLFIYDGAAWHEIGTNLVVLNTDQTWTFDCDFTISASATCDVYLNGVLKASGVDCSWTGTWVEGQVNLRQYGFTLANCITYVDTITIGDDLVTDSIDTWEDVDGGTNSESSQVVFQGDSCFKFDSGDQTSGNFAHRKKDIGSFTTRTVYSFSVYHSALGVIGDVDYFTITTRKNNCMFHAGFASDGLFIHDGVVWNEAGTDLVQIGVWQHWTFDCDFSTPASATCDVYLNGVFKVSGADCSRTGSFSEGETQLLQYGYAMANRITYVKDIKIGDDLVEVTFTFSNPIPIHQAISYGLTTVLRLTTTIIGSDDPYTYDAKFYNGYNDIQIGSTVSGIESGNYASTTFTTSSGGEYGWYVTATSSGEEDTSNTYTFTNKFLCAGDVKVDEVLTSGIYVRLYRRSTGTLVGEEISTISGTFQIETDYNEEHYCVALGPDENTNALIYDRVGIT